MTRRLEFSDLVFHAGWSAEETRRRLAAALRTDAEQSKNVEPHDETPLTAPTK